MYDSVATQKTEGPDAIPAVFFGTFIVVRAPRSSSLSLSSSDWHLSLEGRWAVVGWGDRRRCSFIVVRAPRVSSSLPGESPSLWWQVPVPPYPHLTHSNMRELTQVNHYPELLGSMLPLPLPAESEACTACRGCAG